MKFNKILYAQEGAMMPAPEEQGAPMGPEAAPAEAQGGPEEQLAGIAQQLVEMLMQQIGDPQAVAAILQMALEMVSQAGAPAPAQFQRNGGRIQRVR